MSDTVFNRLYKALNPRQREAVDTIQGPVMVIAGPGTGKTSLLTLRIANILQKTDTAPDSILALTFTESGAYSMRRKLVEIIGGTAYRAGIFTFHGFCNHLIGRYPESFPRIGSGRPATASDQVRILEGIFARNRFKIIRPFGDIFYYVPKALRAIRELKRENISPAAFLTALRAEARRERQSPTRLHASGRFKGEKTAAHRELLRRIEKSRELAVAYQEYEAALAQEQLFDFEDMLLETIRALQKDRGLLLTLQEQYQYILADEHQDANNAQNKILELLCSFDERPNLFIVGDEKQAIYRFQGASLENFLYFKKRYPSAALVLLEENYRSPQSILDAAHALIMKGNIPPGLPREMLRPRLKGQSAGDRRDIRFFEFRSPESERLFLVQDISRRLKEGVKPSEIAVLVRDNEDALPISEAFERTRIPFSVFADEDILSDAELRKLLLVLRAAAEPGNHARFAEMLHLDFLNVSPVALYELLSFCRRRRVSLFDALRNKRTWKEARLSADSAILRLFSELNRWARLAQNAGAGEAVETIARESGFVRYLLASRGSLRALEKLDALFSHLKELAAHRRVFLLADFLDALERLRKHGLRLSGRGARPEFYESVTLMTAHRSKGLEFDLVYLVGVSDGHWGGRRGRSDFYIPLTPPQSSPLKRGGGKTPPQSSSLKMGGSKNGVAVAGSGNEEDEDERRLFFVALTRARKEAVMTMAREGEMGRPRLPSPFLADIDAPLFVREETKKIEERLAKEAPFYLKPRVNAGPAVTVKEYLQRLFLEQGLTVTALNNYLSCPWEYFFKNLARLPQLPEPYLLYGTAMHDSLHAFFERRRAGKRAGKADLLSFFERELERSPLPLREFEEYRRRGRAALGGYFDLYRSSFLREILNECEITGVFLPFGKNKKLLLRGVLDKIERNPGGTVTVVDYKTGRPKSRAEILGETKASEGNMKRQLDFYKLLLDLQAGRVSHLSSFKGAPSHHFVPARARVREGFLMTRGTIDFVEPDAKGKYHRESFEITDKDAAALAEEVQRVGREIYDLAFWDKKCKDRKCKYCFLRQSLA